MGEETMTSRERVIKAIKGEPTDRMPIDLGVHFSTGISVFAYKNLRRYLGLNTDNIEIADSVQMLARVDNDILERFQCDCILLNPPLANPVRWNIRDDCEFLIPKKMKPELSDSGDWIVRKGGESMRMPSGGFFFDGDWLGISEFDSYEEELQAYAKRAEQLYKETDYYTMQMGYSAFFDGIDHACDMYTDPDAVIAKQNKLLEDMLTMFDKSNDAYGKYIQCIAVNSDLGTQNAPMIDPDMYGEFCMPYLKKFCAHVHNTSDVQIFIHTCGSINPLIPHLIEAGIDVMNPVQISADNMDPIDLKAKYGDKIAFWGGGCNTQQVLNMGTPDDVRGNVRELISAFKPNGRFVFNQVHNIMGDVAPENIVAMLDEAYANAFYE